MCKRIIGMVVMLALVFVLSAVTFAESNAPLRTVTVTGEGMVNVEPNVIKIYLGVEVEMSDLKEAKKHADQVILSLINVARRAKVVDKDIKTEYLQIHPRKHENSKVTYFVFQNIQIVLRDFSMFDLILKDAISAGANRINNISFQSSDYEKHKTQAMLLAISDAKEKARQMAGEFGLRVGKPISIQDETISTPQVYGYETKSYASLDRSGGSTLSAGEIVISSRVIIVFELE